MADEAVVQDQEIAAGFAEATPGEGGAPAAGGERQPEKKPEEQPAGSRADGEPAPEKKPDAPKAGEGAETDPIKLAEDRAAQRQREADEKLVREEAERKRQEQQQQRAQPAKLDMKAKLDAFEAETEKRGIMFTSPDPDKKDPISFKELRAEFPYMAEMALAMSMLGSESTLAPIQQTIAQQQAEREYQAFVSRLEDPNGPAKLPAGSVDAIMQHPEFDAYFEKERPGLHPLLASDDPEDVAMALRAFAAAKKLNVLEPAKPAENEEQREAREAAERRRQHRMAVHSGAPGGSAAPRNPRLNPEEEASAGFAEGAGDE